VWTRRPKAAAALTDAHGGVACDSFEELLGEVDAVAFAVPPAVQAELAPRAARAGKHLILEKPLADDVGGAECIAGAVSEAGVAALLMLTLRYAARTREWLAELATRGGWAGGSSRWLSGSLLGETYGRSPWRQAQGALADVGPHVIDLLDAALGPVAAVPAARCDGDGLWHLMFAHDGGATSTATLSARLPIRPTTVEFAVYGRHGLRTLSRDPDGRAACYTALLDDLTSMVTTGTRTHPCDVRRGVHLQHVLAECLRVAGR
jgi:predicted dehydrogenase